MLTFNEITDFLTNVFKAAAFSCVIIILIVIGVVLLVLKWTVFIDDKKTDSPESEVENWFASLHFSIRLGRFWH